MTKIRKGKSADFEKVKSVMNEWWGGRQVDHLQHELFFDHFTDTVFVAENEKDEMIGFINGFYSQTDKNVAYVHFIGVAPTQRKTGLGRKLYQQFFEKCREDGRRKIQSCTSKINLQSIRFHESLGFSNKEDHHGKIRFEKVLG